MGFLGQLASHQSFQEGDVHTGFIEVGVVLGVVSIEVGVVSIEVGVVLGVVSSIPWVNQEKS